ncbi:MAG TPA: acylphosphatase [Candidatus Saccharimonadales bacterium]|nr:acylphosphatase [Candidatus Saccharimonadales bacterium]
MTVNIIISGQVQGVFFRKSAKAEAEKLGLVGWIKNNSDGSVETLAVGSKEKLEKFVTWCKAGPPFGEVENIKVEWKDQNLEFDSFEIV